MQVLLWALLCFSARQYTFVAMLDIIFEDHGGLHAMIEMQQLRDLYQLLESDISSSMASKLQPQESLELQFMMDVHKEQIRIRIILRICSSYLPMVHAAWVILFIM
ncbi:hypothetical protein SAY87_018113 [Trapa incisa]|uniref:Uncharacterized protein n=1 Tax=Trapa incisa TaxID=236973 RepID=A0AAN7L2W0_9MYRT|nr:hypothetical protein SAY87_018113 [Trapa incisa]